MDNHLFEREIYALKAKTKVKGWTAGLAGAAAAVVLFLAALSWYPPLRQKNFGVLSSGPFLAQDEGGENEGRVNVNRASLEELCVLPGIGEVRAQSMLEYRARHGPFGSLEDLGRVPGIGPKTLEALTDLICF
jgi:competence protein ComEA